MLKVDTQDLGIRYYENDYIYIINCNRLITEIKRIKTSRERELLERLLIKNNNVIFTKNITENNNKERIKLTKEEEITIITEILNSLKNNNLANDLLDLKTLNNLIKEKYSNILIENTKLRLSSMNYKEIIHKDKFEIDIISKYYKKIIGNITIDNDDLIIQVPDKYLKDSLVLFYKLICIYKKEQKNYDVKVLKLEGNTK
ncbi:MAG: hypothetical protein IJD92_01650 [Bacilli bacterium]|nr:hypothetical protein [Bacilli bacterium]